MKGNNGYRKAGKKHVLQGNLGGSKRSGEIYMAEEMNNAISAHFLFASSSHPAELSGLAVRSDEQCLFLVVGSVIKSG